MGVRREEEEGKEHWLGSLAYLKCRLGTIILAGVPTKEHSYIRTAGLNLIDLEKSFVPSGCPPSTRPQQVFALGAGVIASELQDAAEKEGLITVGPYADSVGVAGGWALGGGAAGAWQPI